MKVKPKNRLSKTNLLDIIYLSLVSMKKKVLRNRAQYNLSKLNVFPLLKHLAVSL